MYAQLRILKILLLSALIQVTVIFGASKMKEPLRVEITPQWPLDPAKIKTMADYDMTLALYRTWFTYDSSRTAKPGIVSDWEFNDKEGTYKFVIDKKSRWSNGSSITPKQLIFNLKRLLKINSNFGKSIDAIIDIDNIKYKDSHTFIIKTKDSKPSKAFFQRMGSSFLSVVHPSDIGNDGKIKSNTLSSGPYYVENISNNIIKLKKNPYDMFAPINRPSSIAVKTNSRPSDLMTFVESKSWANIKQTYTLLPLDISKKILKNKLPYWTRGHDRVSLMRPLGKNIKDLRLRKSLLNQIGKIWDKINIDQLPFNSTKAFSLQPIGYPLFHEKVKIKESDHVQLKKKSVKIITFAHESNQFHKELISDCFRQFGINVEWIIKESPLKMIESANNDSSIDFALFGFGVADPEPTTWLGLVFGKDFGFINYNESDYKEFENISKLESHDYAVDSYKKLLVKLRIEGSYLPLFHFSTLSIGHKGINFKNIEELDETVDYSKLSIE